MKKLRLIVILIPYVLMHSSCSESNIPKTTDELLFNEVQNEVNNTTLEEKAFNIAAETVTEFRGSGFSKIGTMRPIIKKKSESNNFPIDYEIDFGNRYVDKEGNIYSGVINQKYKSKNETELEFENFFINDNIVKGNKKNNVLENGILSIISDVKTINKKTNQTKYRYTEQQSSVINENNIKDSNVADIYTITGFTVGNIFRNGKEFEYNFNIEQPLVFLSGSKSYIKGITIIRIGSSTQYINYGLGEKEKIATWLFK